MQIMAKSALFTDIQNQFAAYIRNPEMVTAPEAIESRRLDIYRDLFFNNIEGTISNTFPVLKSLFDESDWLAMIRDFMIKHRCKTPLFYEIAHEFLDYLSEERTVETDPEFIHELAHYEWVELALGVAEAEFKRDEIPENSLNHHYASSPLAWLLKYTYPVHHISQEFQPTEPADTPIFLLVHRDQDDQVKFIELNIISARFLDLLNTGLKADNAAQKIAEELQHPAPEQVLAGAQGLLIEWLDKGIIHQRD